MPVQVNIPSQYTPTLTLDKRVQYRWREAGGLNPPHGGQKKTRSFPTEFQQFFGGGLDLEVNTVARMPDPAELLPPVPENIQGRVGLGHHVPG